MAEQTRNLTGVWHGLYSYPSHPQPVYFVATVISHGGGFSGSTHEAIVGQQAAPLTAFAAIDGILDGHDVAFKKTYDGSNGWNHSVLYEGTLSSDANEIDGQWSLPGNWSGRFLMIRGTGTTEESARHVYERA
jgi:hypothetical protein